MFFEAQYNQLPMNERRRQMCLRLTKQMMEYPCAKCFLEPVDPDEVEYLRVIKSPQDLTSILSRLENNQYKSVDLWEQDVNLIWYNAEKFNGSHSYIFILASALAKRFSKIKRVVDIERLEDWTKWFFEFEARLDTLTKSSPPKARKHFPAALVREATKVPFTEEEFTALDKALKDLTTPNDLLYLNNILRHHASKIDINAEPVSVDLRELPNQALHLMKEYSMKRFQEMGKTYPAN
ncbi:Bromodomain containing protein [Tritrichomonas foetus]|uniref:Bromodomain containing protein n=1 Tax=Tritrichomonas foetus TaxID=1144522 RepID=A0A1J4L079_9EUKA|nr:Bromodomain containing protein [Tritrichomonas foetus]|eukprot:OHT16875.1 Bromodomain containing protein [Tritrichomonas foetus]